MSTDNLPDLPTYQPTRFKTDGGFEPSGILILIIGMAAAAMLMGGIAYWVSQYFYLVLLFPIAIGVAIGLVGFKIIKTARIRNMGLVMVIGLMAGVLSMGTMHYLGFMEYQKYFTTLSDNEKEFLALPSEKQQEIMAQAPEADRADMQMFLASHSASQSFPAYMDQQAKIGVRLGKVGRSGSSIGYTGSIIYWILETCFVAVFIILLVRDAVGQPYCTRCHVWKENMGGFTWKADLEPVQNAFETGRMPELAKSICVDSKSAGPTAKALSLDYFECSKCHTMSPTEMFLAVLTPDKHGKMQPSIKSKMTYPGAAQSDVKKIVSHLAQEKTT